MVGFGTVKRVNFYPYSHKWVSFDKMAMRIRPDQDGDTNIKTVTKNVDTSLLQTSQAHSGGH